YTGNSVASLQRVAANDEDPLSSFGLESRVTCNVISNVTYNIAVDGWDGASGPIRLRLNLDASFPVPPNDDFAAAWTLSGNNVLTNGSNVGATMEPDEPLHLATLGGKSVWWKWRAPASGGVMLSTTNSAVDTILAVYRGSALSNL